MLRPLLSIDTLRVLISYDPESGILKWKHRDRSFFKNDREFKRFHTRYANKEAFTAITNGYKHSTIFGKHFYAHHVVWAIQTGMWPIYKIDHKNHKRDDNRWINLRVVTDLQNSQNMSVPRCNKSGAPGVRTYGNRTKWRATIRANGKVIHLGVFDEFDAAVSARINAQKQYGFHPNHCRGAN